MSIARRAIGSRAFGQGPEIAGGPPPSFVVAWAETDDDDWYSHMKKNVASQTVGRQMVSATDGSAFTGTVTVYVTGDNGTQALGSVGSGVCTHEGNGYHTYAPSQGETNYDKVAFTFIGSGAVPRTLEIWTTFPQTGDGYAVVDSRLPAALVSGRMPSDVIAISGDTVAADNAESFFDGTGYAGTGNVIPTVTTVTTATNVTTVNGLAADVITSTALAASAVTEIQSGLSTLDAAGVRTAVGLASANLDTQIAALPTAAENADANWDEARSGHTTSGTFGESYAAIESGQCITGTLSTTASTTNLTEATDDHYIGRTIVWITGALTRQASAITDYDGATKTLTYAAVTEAPSNGDRFVLV